MREERTSKEGRLRNQVQDLATSNQYVVHHLYIVPEMRPAIWVYLTCTYFTPTPRLCRTAARYRAQISRLRELGTSLADVAAFMQAIELQQGFFTPRLEGGGIERLRFLAMRLEQMGRVKTGKVDDVSTSSTPRYHQ
jgi:hypothetical protein